MRTTDDRRSSTPSNARARRFAPHPLLDEVLRGAVAIGALLLILLPEARGVHPQLGWLPLWLLGMPLVAWWAAYRFTLPGSLLPWLGDGVGRREPSPARRRLPQARRRVRPRPAVTRVRAAA